MGKGGASAIVTREEDFPRWYQEVVARAEMAENGPVRGTMVIRPWGYGIWELMQAELDRRIKAAGAENAYFPLFIPESYLTLEAEHVEGFAPELAVVTHAGGKELEEPLVVRPTSETVINSFFSKWIQSHRDLPLLLNQWANVVRWEMRPRLFLRTSEFLWQEGHTAHATEDDARAYALRILDDVYRSTMVDVLCVPGADRAQDAAGAIRRRDPDLDVRGDDGRRQGAADGHEPRARAELRRAFGITFSNAAGRARVRLADVVGRVDPAHRRAGHGARRRLRPAPAPALAPAQVVVMMVKDDAAVGQAAAALCAELGAAGHRVRLDDRTDTSFGRRSVDWELKGVPVRVEVGPRDLAEGNVTVVVRHRREKRSVPWPGWPPRSAAVLASAGPRPPGRGEGLPRGPDGRCRHVGRGRRGGVGRLRPGPPRRARARRGGPPGRARDHGAVPAAPRRLAGPGRTTPRSDLVAVVGRSY